MPTLLDVDAIIGIQPTGDVFDLPNKISVPLPLTLNVIAISSLLLTILKPKPRTC